MNHREYFNKQAHTWDNEMTGEKMAHIGRLVDRFGIQIGQNILDIGSGTGVILPFLKKQVGENGNVVALDISEKMLKKAREKYGDQFTYVQVAAEDMQFKDKEFDSVICFQVFPHFYDEEKALKQIHRVLKKDGIIIIAHASSRKTINSLHREAGEVVTKDRIPDKEIMYNLLDQAGFNNIVIDDAEKYYLASGIKF